MLRVARAINGWTAVPLLVCAAMFGGLGALQLTRAVPTDTTVAPGRIIGSQHRLGSRSAGESWDVFVEVPGQGSQIAYSHALYDAVQGQGNDLAVTVHLRGELVTSVELAGHTYATSAVSTTEAWVEAVILFALCALTLFGLARSVRRALRAAPG